MGEILVTKIRRIGTSYGVLIPKKLISKGKMKNGEEVEIALLKKRKIALIERAFGITKGAASFERKSEDRI